MTWQAHTQDTPRTRFLQISWGDKWLSFAQVIGLWQGDAAFCAWYNAQLAAAPFAAFFWEHPPLTPDRLDQPYELMLLDSPALARVTADPQPFARYFQPAAQAAGLASFVNLGGDAQLLVPTPVGPEAAYAHLAAFVRQAPAWQQQALWQTLGQQLPAWLGPRPRWLSTSGLGVYWLHLRLDQRPKYYQHRPYREGGA